MKENTTVLVTPLQPESEQLARPIICYKKKASRPTQYELAVKYAEERKMKLEQESAEMERLRQNSERLIVPGHGASNGIDIAESKESEDFDCEAITADVPIYRPPMDSYERAIMETDSESEEERRQKIKQQTPRSINKRKGNNDRSSTVLIPSHQLNTVKAQGKNYLRTT